VCGISSEALGVRLLDRTTRSVVLTQVGREFLPVIQRVLDEISAVALNARELAGRRRGVVTVAALPSIASTLLPAIIATFKTRQPGITVRLRDGVEQRVAALVKSGDADFGIGSPTRRDPRLRLLPLLHDPISVVFSPGHPLERRRRVRPGDLLAYPLILMDREYSVRRLIDAVFESLGRVVAPAFEASYVATALGLVKAGLGVTVIAFSAAAAAATEAAGLCAHVIDHPTLVRHISVIEEAGRSLSPAAQQFLDAIRDACRQSA
jgi:DNA-binding transcriptional LysR family regulator